VQREITQADINEAQTSYEDIFIDVIADTYDKVDAAVVLLEPLLTSVLQLMLLSPFLFTCK
jgi:splicing factor 1